MQTNDVRLKRLLALATQKFIADIAADAYQYSRIRQNSSNAGGAPGIGVPGVGAAGAGAVGGGALRPTARPGFGGGGGSGGTAGRTVLTMEDLGSAVGEYGVNTRRPEFYR
jgi:transcription initiation factor TFIID subunit 10